METTGYNELEALLVKIQNGLESEKEAALRELYERVGNSDDPQAWNLLGVGYLQSSHYTEAIQVFSVLVKNLPENDVYRVNLAAAYSYAGQLELARYHYQHLVDHATTEEGQNFGRDGLTSLRQALQEEESEKAYLDLQIAALRERRAHGEADPKQYRRLAFIYLQRERSKEPLASLTEITSLLEEGSGKYPQSVELLELLALCYSRIGNDDRLEATIRSIEKIDPDNQVLQTFQRVDTRAGEDFKNQMLNRAYALFEQSQSPDPDLRQAALVDLSKMVMMYPANPSYRGLYGFALAGVGQKTEAIQQAEILAESAGEEHSTHFNIGQIFWMSGDPERGHKHLELAYRYATDEKERQDVRERIADLESGG